MHLKSFFALFLLCALVLPGFANTEREAKREVLRKLERTTIPRISYDDVRVRDALRDLRDRIRQLDLRPDIPFNMIVRAEEKVLDARITLELENLPAGEAIRYMCIAAGLHYRVESHAIVVFDAAAQVDRMETRVFHIDPSLIRSLNNHNQNQ